MAGFLHKARRYLFGYDAVESKNRRQVPTGRGRALRRMRPSQGKRAAGV